MTRVPVHGRAGTYTNHGCRCGPCTDAHARMIRERREKIRQALILKDGRPYHPDVKHGRQVSYQHYGCRCKACTDANSAVSKVNRDYRKKKKRGNG